MKYAIARDTNGNKTLRITPPHGRGFSIQTNGNLPATHRDGITERTEAEARAYVAEHGTPRQRHALGLPMTRPRPVFINRKGGGYRETVDQFDTHKEAREMLREYRMSDPSAEHYLSSRACKGWND
jgi:hypothetical protein